MKCLFYFQEVGSAYNSCHYMTRFLPGAVLTPVLQTAVKVNTCGVSTDQVLALGQDCQAGHKSNLLRSEERTKHPKHKGHGLMLLWGVSQSGSGPSVGSQQD